MTLLTSTPAFEMLVNILPVLYGMSHTDYEMYHNILPNTENKLGSKTQDVTLNKWYTPWFPIKNPEYQGRVYFWY